MGEKRHVLELAQEDCDHGVPHEVVHVASLQEHVRLVDQDDGFPCRRQREQRGQCLVQFVCCGPEIACADHVERCLSDCAMGSETGVAQRRKTVPSLVASAVSVLPTPGGPEESVKSDAQAARNALTMQGKYEPAALPRYEVVELGHFLRVRLDEHFHDVLLRGGDVQMVERLEVPVDVLDVVGVEDHCGRSSISIKEGRCAARTGYVLHFLSARPKPYNLAGNIMYSSSVSSTRRTSFFRVSALRSSEFPSRSFDTLGTEAFEYRAYFSGNQVTSVQSQNKTVQDVPRSMMILDFT